jgi:dolichyl-phosphate beta-glucosyltransferase
MEPRRPAHPDPRPHSKRLTIVLPAFNEAARIGPALHELFAYLRSGPGGATPDGLPALIDVLVVDDGSTDGTVELVLARPEAAAHATTPLHVLQVAHGGKGAAVKAGLLAAHGDFIVFADADMATPPDQLPILLAALQTADVALGSRIQPDHSDMRASQPPLRRFLGKAFHLLASIWIVGPVEDTQCGFKGFTREAAHDLAARQRVTSIVFDVELIHLARRRGYRLAVVPVRWTDVHGSRMRASPGLALRVAWDLFRIPFLHRGVRRATASRAEV